MKRFRFYTAGESHGPALTVIIQGVPFGMPLLAEDINKDLARRQGGYGRGPRSRKIERDQVTFLAGVRHGVTIGSPIALLIENKDFENWSVAMSPQPVTEETPPEKKRPFYLPRPGHADLAGAMKFLTYDLRPVLERASARETAARVAAGAVAKKLLNHFKVQMASHVLSVGPVQSPVDSSKLTVSEIWERAESSELRCLDPITTEKMKALIDEAMKEGETLGGQFEVVVDGVPVGLGSYAHWDEKLDGRLAQAVMSIHGVKGVEIGRAFEMSGKKGSQVHDPILPPDPHPTDWRFFPRATNNSGGLEGGVTNGERLIVRGAMKPLSTLRRPLSSVNLLTGEVAKAHVERSDVCAIAACAVVAEAMVAIILADAILEKFGGDTLKEIEERVTAYKDALSAWAAGKGKEEEATAG
ncbi:MAG: chorismate synthase [Armatimonadetes bacterium]|nr:chorismate synthase [Armatimonadota bacterium]MDW8122252.1 chorismate synthase [Armatimonadota bacterium]